MSPSLVACPECQLHLQVVDLFTHVCLTSNRLSQISTYDALLLISTGNCTRCHHPNASIVIQEKYYHQHCLSCFYCRKTLTMNTMNSFEGDIYCHYDYQQIIISRPHCPACLKKLEPYVRPTILVDKYYHPEHICCHKCHKPVDPYMTGIAERKGKVYCQTDFNMLFLPKCQACQRPIEKQAVISVDQSLGGSYHKQCFRCHLCNVDFPDNKFYTYNNAPYCRKDYHKLSNTLCHKCQEPIIGQCLEKLHKKYHPACLLLQ